MPGRAGVLPAQLAGRAGAESPQVAALSPEASPFSYSLCAFVGLWICVPSSNLSQFEEKISSRRRLHFDQPQPLGVLIWGLEASVKRIASGNCRGQQLNFCFWRVLLHKRLHSTVQRLPIENVDRGGFDSFTRFPRSMRKMKLKLFPTWNCLKKQRFSCRKQLLKQCRLQIQWGMDPLTKKLDLVMIQVSDFYKQVTFSHGLS